MFFRINYFIMCIIRYTRIKFKSVYDCPEWPCVYYYNDDNRPRAMRLHKGVNTRTRFRDYRRTYYYIIYSFD